MGSTGLNTMQIGEVARRADVNVQTLRYYERRGLILPQRRPSGYREYPDDTVRLVRFIKRAQELGFTLRDVQELIELRQKPYEDSCAGARAGYREGQRYHGSSSPPHRHTASLGRTGECLQL